MVFDRKHLFVSKDTPVGSVSGIVDNYNNTNASGYINKIRFYQNLQNLNKGGGEGFFVDPPPEE